MMYMNEGSRSQRFFFDSLPSGGFRTNYPLPLFGLLVLAPSGALCGVWNDLL